MEGSDGVARRRSDRLLVRMLARRYRRDADLAQVLRHEVKDYELADRHCRWITAGLMHRLNRLLRRQEQAVPTPLGAGMTGLVIRACLRGEARCYREQSRELPAAEPERSHAPPSSRPADSTRGHGKC